VGGAAITSTPGVLVSLASAQEIDGQFAGTNCVLDHRSDDLQSGAKKRVGRIKSLQVAADSISAPKRMKHRDKVSTETQTVETEKLRAEQPRGGALMKILDRDFREHARHAETLPARSVEPDHRVQKLGELCRVGNLDTRLSRSCGSIASCTQVLALAIGYHCFAFRGTTEKLNYWTYFVRRLLKIEPTRVLDKR